MTERRLQDAPSLLVDTYRHFTSLVQGEIRLARAEMSEIVTRAGVGIALIAGAFLFALVAVHVLATAIIAQLVAMGLSVAVASLIVCLGFFAIALVMALIGKSRLSASALTPHRTDKNIRDDIEAIREATHV